MSFTPVCGTYCAPGHYGAGGTCAALCKVHGRQVKLAIYCRWAGPKICILATDYATLITKHRHALRINRPTHARHTTRQGT